MIGGLKLPENEGMSNMEKIGSFNTSLHMFGSFLEPAFRTPPPIGLDDGGRVNVRFWDFFENSEKRRKCAFFGISKKSESGG